jgi:general secretion pathway protein J
MNRKDHIQNSPRVARYLPPNICPQTLTICNPVANIQYPPPASPEGKADGGQAEPSIRHPAKGFTLIEILVALFIFAIVATTIFGSYNSVFSNAESIKDDMTSYEMAKNCLNRMIIDLQSLHVSLPPAYSIPGNDDGPDPYRLVGDTTDVINKSFARLRFTSLAHVALGTDPRQGIAEIIYYVTPTDEGKFILRRSDRLYPYEPVEGQTGDPVLCENIKDLEFKYYAAEGEVFESWDSDSEDVKHSTPQAIGIKMVLGNELRSQVFETTVKLLLYRNNIE